MVLLTPNENHTAGSGLINMPYLESVYQSIIAETFVDLGRDVVLHLEPIKEQDVTTQSKPQAGQVNPFFGGRVPVPRTTTRQTGVKVTPRDVTYKAHICVGPLKEGPDISGIGDLKANEAVATLDIGALDHLSQTLSVSIEGRRYSIMETRPFGFSSRRYILVKMEEINEQDTSTGENHG